MREDIIDAAAVNIELFAEDLGRHCAALDMPARPPASPWAFPANRAVCFVPRFPKREITDMFFVVLVVLDTAGRLQFVRSKCASFPYPEIY